ncbi:sulfurtransferase-like selenium metabolism protein YedF [Xylocopilactobacillus apicola]|uniref:Selenium metabolism protein YedF n=1 Tax=Xylocopilactobacillus apicola TaxID=2932184 RepID=A0AAU9CUD3_9LACO|nr:sulfurtransferase-like selenium metabolism protein YedF [Xylocopilactobacillus apicola]BDR57607.1 selenium metabolism protein YedF [Xylocopilactobacillus apicola]
MKKIDARGLACPLPVIKAKKALRDHTEIQITVDNEEAAENLEKLAQQLQYSFSKQEIGNQDVQIEINRENSAIQRIPTPAKVSQAIDDNLTQAIEPAFVNNVRLSDGYLTVIGTNVMGQGDDQLGAILMKSFIYSLTEQDVLPETVIFFNGGVKLLVEGSESVPDIKALQEKGVKILVCGTCVDFYGIKDQLQVGEITNLYHILELMRKAQRIVKP